MSEQSNPDRRTVSVPENLLERMIKLHEKEHRSRQIRFYLLILVFLVPSLIYAVTISPILKGGGDGISKNSDYVSLVRLDGAIEPDGEASAQDLLPALEAAFKDEKAKGVVLLINSPGGTPVQSGVLYDRVKSLKARYKKPVVAMGRDAMASGAYMVAVAADKIYANEATVVGSIGVKMEGFGFDDLIHKYGVERRIVAAGKNKVRSDPFMPRSQADIDKLTAMLNGIHQQFIAKVKTGRGSRLKGDPAVLYSGDFWTGEEALGLGLIDGVSDLPQVLQENFGVEAVKDFTKRNLFGDMVKKLMGQFSASLSLHAEYTPLSARAF